MVASAALLIRERGAHSTAIADVLAHIAVLGTVDGSVPEEKGEKEGKPESPKPPDKPET